MNKAYFNCDCKHRPGTAFKVDNIGNTPICPECKKPLKMICNVKKVYCKSCKWYDDEIRAYSSIVQQIMGKCFHFKNTKDTPLEPVPKFIEEANKNNDCKLYEKKD